MIRLKSAGKTDVGLKREENEDNFIMLPDHGLYVLADGMGGHASGKMASTLAVTLITEFIAVRAVKPDFQFEYPIDENLAFEANVLCNAIKYASERIFIESCKDRSMEGMGTTVTAILATDNDFILAHVGDSRIYRLRDGKLQQMTQDHSLLNHMIEIGEIKREDAHKFANKNVILRAVGLKDTVQVSVQVVPKRAGDTYMMCSDGLSDLVPDDVIAEVLRTAESLPAACNQLIQLALRAGGKDNVTVVTVAAEDVPPGEELGWGTGTFTRKQAEAAALLAGAGAPAGQAPALGGRSVQRPRTPVNTAPAPGPASVPLARPQSMAAPARAPMRGGMAPEPSPPAVSGRGAMPEPPGPAAGQRLHAVRRPQAESATMRARPAAAGGHSDAPPQRPVTSAAMPAPPPRQASTSAPNLGVRRMGSTPAEPAEPIASGASNSNGWRDAESPWHSPAQEPPARPRPAAFPPPSAPPSEATWRATPGGPPPADPRARRRSTPTDLPAFGAAAAGAAPAAPGFDEPSDDPRETRPTSGVFAPPSGRPLASNASGVEPAVVSPPPGSLAQASSGIFQAPPPGVFPQTRPAQPPATAAPAAAAPQAPSRDTVEDVPVITRSTTAAAVARDTVRDIPVITRGQQTPPEESEEETPIDDDDADPEEKRPTTLVPQITRGQIAAAAAATPPPPAAAPAAAPEPPSAPLGRPLSGERALTERTSYRDQGSIQIDNSLFTQTQDDEESIVVDESLLMELVGDDDDGPQRNAPPPPPGGGGDDPRRSTGRPTELLPITGARRKP